MSAFYSFKGGAGRSVLLANVASILASRGKKVVCIDFDLEAGGLHTIFGISSNDVRYSILDYLLGDIVSPEPAIIDLSSNLPGRLLLLPAVSDYRRLGLLNTQGDKLAAALRKIKDRLVVRYNPEFILVDTRAGYAELAYAPLDVANSVVCVMRLNKQNTDGLRLFFDVIENIPDPPVHCVIVTQVPVQNGEETAEASLMIQRVRAGLGEGRQIETIVPYDARLAIEEKILAIIDPSCDITARCQRVADWIQARANEAR